MKYALEKINTIAGCDALLIAAQKKRQTLERRRRNLGESINEFRGRLNQIASETLDVQQSLTAFTAAWQSMSQGRHKARMNVMVKRLALHQARLEMKLLSCNPCTLLLREAKYNRLQAQVEVLDHYIVEVQRQRAELGRAAVRMRLACALRKPVTRNGQTITPQVSPATLRQEALSYHKPPGWQSAYSNEHIPGAGSS